MRLDHVAYRTKNRHKTAEFFKNCFGYALGEGDELTDGGFKLKFPDGTTADCLVLVPPEKTWKECSYPTDRTWQPPWVSYGYPNIEFTDIEIQYHLAPEIFISDGGPGSIVGKWVDARGGVGGIHHMAYQVDDVKAKMTEWKDKGYAEFASEEPLTCPGLTQVFTKPSELTGIIYELIHREKQGFCKTNVVDLMTSTKDF